VGIVRGGPGFKLAERVADFVRDRELLVEGDAVIVGVSGGPDSMCLLHVLSRFELDLDLLVAHVDHGLSDSSEEVAARVAREAAEAGFDVHVARAKGLEGSNLQERARDFRYAFFDTLAVQEGARVIATGHTLDDRVETTLARLIHGAGGDGLAGLRPRAGNRIHPLLPLRRGDTRSYCDEVGLTYHDDPANEDPRFERSRIRSDVIGAIEAGWGEGSVRAMATAIDRLGEDADALGGQAETLFAGLMKEDTERRLRFDLATIRRLPRALQRRILELAVGRVRDRAGGINAALDAVAGKTQKPDARFAVAEGGEIVVGTDEVIVVPPFRADEKKK
jgi:tRNA(Ile)-lysidine synthase